MREQIIPRAGARAGDGVTVSWRKSSARTSEVLVVTLGAASVTKMGLTRGRRVIVERDREAGRLYLRADAETGWRPAWKEGCCCLSIPLDDVRADRKPAQVVHTEWHYGELCIRLPPWACPPVKINARRAA